VSHVIAEPCIGEKNGVCVDVCPVACIHTTPEAPQYYIDPDVCIECEQCVLVCPVQAIFLDSDLPAVWGQYRDVNSAFFRHNKAAGHISDDQANAIIEALQAYAAGNGLSLATVVLASSGELAKLAAMSGAAPDALGEADRKAYAALAYRVATNQIRPGAKPADIGGAAVDEDRLLIGPGGAPLVQDGAIVGAVGVAGANAEQQVLCCQVAAETLRAASH